MRNREKLSLCTRSCDSRLQTTSQPLEITRNDMACVIDATFDALTNSRGAEDVVHNYGRGCSLSAERGARTAPSFCKPAFQDFGFPSPAVLHHFGADSPPATSYQPCVETAQQQAAAECHCYHPCCVAFPQAQAAPNASQADFSRVVARARVAASAAGDPASAEELPEWVVSGQCPEPAWWEGSLSAEVHQTLREREAVLSPIQFKSPQLAKRYIQFAHSS